MSSTAVFIRQKLLGSDPRWQLLTALGIALFLLATVLLTWNHPYGTTALLVVALWVQWRYGSRPGDGVVMLMAALLGTPAEMVEVSLGEWTYHAPHLLWGIPLWIPLIWANMFALFCRLARIILALCATAWPIHNAWVWKRLFPFLGGSVLVYWALALAWMDKMPIVIGLYAGFMILISSLWFNRWTMTLFWVGAILGTVGEFLCIQEGYWHYYNPYFSTLGIDITLPLDWGLSAVLIDQIAKTLTRKE